MLAFDFDFDSCRSLPSSGVSRDFLLFDLKPCLWLLCVYWNRFVSR